MPLPPVPDWLTARQGALKPGTRDHIVFVMLGGQPQYRVEARPAQGKHSCAVTMTVNGRRLDDGSTFPTADAALAAGLDQLRAALGW